MASKNARNFEFKLGKQALVLFILGMSVLLISVFLFGVMVGEHIDAYPEMVSKGIPDMIRKKFSFGKEKTQTNVAVRAESEDAGDDENGEFDLTFYDTLMKKRSTGTNAARHGKPGTETVKAPALVPKVAPGVVAGGVSGNAPGNAAVQKTPAGVVGESNPRGGGTPAADTDDKKPPMPAGSGHGDGAGTAGKGYIIHLASFRERERSDLLAKKLAALGYAASLETRDLPGKGKWFRVVVRDFKTREDAQEALDAIGAKIRGLKATIIAVDEKQGR